MKGNQVSGGNFVIDMDSIKNEDVKSAKYNAKLVGHLKSADFFDVGNHKEAKFAISKVSGNKISGTLTIKGIAQKIDFPATVSVKGNTATAKAKFQIDRTRWKIVYNSANYFKKLGDKVINDKIDVELDLVAQSTKKSGKKKSS